MSTLRPMLSIILPTRPLFRTLRPYSLPLLDAQLTPEFLIEYVISQWGREEYNFYNPLFDTHVSTMDRIRAYAESDLLMPLRNQPIYQDRERFRIIDNAMHRCIELAYRELVPVLDDMELADHQLQTLTTVGWVGRDLVVTVER